jgi:hypothetical protein
VAVTEPRLQRRELDPLGEELPFLAEVAHRVLGERLERLRYAAALFGELPFELRLLEHASRRKARSVAVEAGAAHGEKLPLVHVLEETVRRDVDQANAPAHEGERTRVRKASGLRRSNVHHDANA